MANPLRGEGGSSGGGGPLHPGESRTVVVREKDGSISKTLTINRTSRAYAYDLCDAYNAANTRPDVHWIVGHDGNPHMQFSQAPEDLTKDLKAHAEADRQRWIHRHNHPERYVA